MATKREVAGSPLGPQNNGRPGRYINVRLWGGLSMVFLQLENTGSGFLSRRYMTQAVESDVKPQTFLPSFLG